MTLEFHVKACKLGATIHCTGVTADLTTGREVDEAVDRIRVKLDRAAAEAKAAIQVERAKGAYD